MNNEIYYVTGNIGKFSEVADFFKKNSSEIVIKHYPLDIDEIQSLDQAGSRYAHEKFWPSCPQNSFA